MSLRDTSNHLHHLLTALSKDLTKATNGNRAAAQRVRTGTIRFQKIAKQYRKESVAVEKQQRKSKRKKSRRK